MLRTNSEQKGRNLFPRVAFVPGRRGRHTRVHTCAVRPLEDGLWGSGGAWRGVMGVWAEAQRDTREGDRQLTYRNSNTFYARAPDSAPVLAATPPVRPTRPLSFPGRSYEVQRAGAALGAMTVMCHCVRGLGFQFKGTGFKNPVWWWMALSHSPPKLLPRTTDEGGLE